MPKGLTLIAKKIASSTCRFASLAKLKLLNCLFNVTINDISVIYVTAHRCAGGLKKKFDLRSGSQSHRHFVGLFNVPVQAPTRDHLFIRWFRHTAPFSRLLRSSWGYWGHILDLNPRALTGVQVWQLITRSQFDDWWHIVHHWKGNFHSFETIFPQDQKVYTRRQNTNFSIVHLSSQHSATSPTLGPATTIKREIYYMRHTTSERPQESDLLVEKKKGG